MLPVYIQSFEINAYLSNYAELVNNLFEKSIYFPSGRMTANIDALKNSLSQP